VQCDSTTDSEGWIYGSSWNALGWRGSGASGGWLAQPAERQFGRYSCGATDTVRRRRWVFFPGPRIPVGQRVVAQRALVATNHASADEDTRTDADADASIDADSDANADADSGAAHRVCTAREWGALVCAQPALPTEAEIEAVAGDEADEEVLAHADGASDSSGAAAALPPPPPLPPVGALHAMPSRYSHDTCTYSMPFAAPSGSSSQARLLPRAPPEPLLCNKDEDDDEDEITSLFGNIEDDGDLCAVAQYRSLQQHRQVQAEPQQQAQVEAQPQAQMQAQVQALEAADDDTAPADTDDFGYVHLRKTKVPKPAVATIPPAAPGQEAAARAGGRAGFSGERPFNGIFHDNDDDDCDWVDVVAEVERLR